MRVDCEGAPRDLGFDQGRAMFEGVDAELARILRERPAGGGIDELGRDVARHFPQLAERMTGLARGSRVDPMALVVALARASREPAFLLRPALAFAARTPRTRLAARFDLSADLCSVPIVRRSAPQGGFESIELTLPWLATCLGGVNAEGLAALLAPPPLAISGGEVVRAEATCRAPAMLFVQQCLERFGRADSAAEWCLTRPSDGSATILLADATGAVVSVELDEDRRRVIEPPLATIDDEAASLPALLAAGDAAAVQERTLAHRGVVWIDVADRALAVALDREGIAPACIERFALSRG